MTNNSPDNTKPATHSTDLVLDRVATISDIENRLPDSKEIWYGHSILTSTLFPATPPAEGTDFVSKDNSTVEYILEAGIDSLTRSRDFPYGKYPRLLMAWMAKQIRSAGTRKTPTVDPSQRTITIPSMYQLSETFAGTVAPSPVLSYQHQAENRVCGQPGSVRLREHADGEGRQLPER